MKFGLLENFCESSFVSTYHHTKAASYLVRKYTTSWFCQALNLLVYRVHTTIKGLVTVIVTVQQPTLLPSHYSIPCILKEIGHEKNPPSPPISVG